MKNLRSNAPRLEQHKVVEPQTTQEANCAECVNILLQPHVKTAIHTVLLDHHANNKNQIEHPRYEYGCDEEFVR
jgi:hypothetical protein